MDSGRQEEGERAADAPWRACVIGAGSSGIVAAKVLRERGIPFDCFEMGSRIGGLWRYRNDNGRSPAYASLETNTSRSRTGYACFPLPEEGADYPHHTELLAYFEDFVEHYGLEERISFRRRVTRVAPGDARGAPPGAPERRRSWNVTVRDLDTGEEKTRPYDAVLVASGHHWSPRWPEFPGGFGGLELHSREYRTPDLLRDRRVLVVGIGNSACDIACEAAGVARRTFLSTRRGAHVLPKRLFGRPIDTWVTPLSSRLPVAFQRGLLGLLVRLARGPQTRYGVPVPDHGIGEEHPTISRHLLELADEGAVEVKPDVERLEGDRVRFTDGSEERVDVIVYATGYDLRFPFLGPLGEAFASPPGNRLPLYLHVVPPDRPGLYFLGLVQPLGAIPPLAEAQAEWVADVLDGTSVLPSPEEMRRAIERRERARSRRYPDTRRHTLEVDFYPYLRAVARERKRGRTRRRGRVRLRERARQRGRARRRGSGPDGGRAGERGGQAGDGGRRRQREDDGPSDRVAAL